MMLGWILLVQTENSIPTGIERVLCVLRYTSRYNTLISEFLM